MDPQADSRSSARFDINEIARSFPDKAQTLLLDTYLTNEPAASARVFRVYRGTPPHYHATCDEYLYVLSALTFEFDISVCGPPQPISGSTSLRGARRHRAGHCHRGRR